MKRPFAIVLALVAVAALFAGLVYAVLAAAHVSQPAAMTIYGLRSIDDLELLWTIIRGPDSCDFEIAPIDWRPPSGRALEHLRVAWTDGFEPYIAGTDTRELLAALAARIERAGARVEKTAPVIHPRAYEVFMHLFGALVGQDAPWLMRKIVPMVVARGQIKGQPHLVRLLRRALENSTGRRTAFRSVSNSLGRTGLNLSSCTSRSSLSH